MDRFGFTVHGNLDELCDYLRKEGAIFSVDTHHFVPEVPLGYLKAPDGVSIGLIQTQ